MRALIVYDSLFGNTAKVANAIAASLRPKYQVILCKPKTGVKLDLKAEDLLILGTPVHGGRPTPLIQQCLDSLTPDVLRQVNVAVFDTRIEASSQKLPLKLLIKTIGYAAEKMALTFQSKGAVLASPPQGFIVESKEGPLKAAELDRAKSWAKSL